MKARFLIIGVSIVSGLATLAAVLYQHHELKNIRTDRETQAAQIAGSSVDPSPMDAVEPSTPSPAASSNLWELLRLRSQVGQLMEQKRQLAKMRDENQRLREQVSAIGTNNSSGAALPPGYIRRSQARWVGMNTLEDTVQSFLWAAQNRDSTNLLRVLTSECGERILQRGGFAFGELFDTIRTLPGMRLVNQKQLPDGSVQAQFEIMPGQPESRIHFQQIGGEWKMDMGS